MAAENKCYRGIVGKTRRDRMSDKIRDELVQVYIDGRLKIKQLKWFGHMVLTREDGKPR